MIAQPTLRERLQAGPGSRELSDAFLLEMGWSYKRMDRATLAKYGLQYRGDVRIYWWFDPSGNHVQNRDRPDPSQITDHALAMVPEGWRVYVMQQEMAKQGARWFVGLDQIFGCLSVSSDWVGGEGDGLRRAICLAILAAKELA